MRLRCPNCREPVEPVEADRLTCANGHQFDYEEGVLVLLGADFRPQLESFTQHIRRFREDEGKRLCDPALYDQLPFAPAVQGEWEWRQRGYDVEHITRLLGRRKEQTILDVGAWNGWLSHRLAQQGHQVTAVDYFADAYDGLGAKQFYSSTWQAIQLDLTDLSVLDQVYDLVIINHGLHFFPDPVAHVAAARRKVRPGGLLVAIGLRFYFDPTARAKEVAALQQRYKTRYGVDIFLKPTKGYLDFHDKRRLEQAGLVLKKYLQLWRENLKAKLKKREAWHYYGVAKG